MAVSNRAKIVLWSKAGGKCSFPNCRKDLVQDATPYDPHTLVGQNAHIVSQKPDGPRGKDEPPGGQIDGYENLILLCGDHHHTIDSQAASYSVAKLIEMRSSHERWVCDTLSRQQRFLGAHEVTELVAEDLVSTLLPVSRMPRFVFCAPCTVTEDVIASHLATLEMTDEIFPFLIRQERLIVFNPLAEATPFDQFIDKSKTRREKSIEWWDDSDRSRWFMTLLNRSLNKLTGRKGLQLDKDHSRYYFPPGDGNEGALRRRILYRTLGNRKSGLNVAWQPRRKSTGETKKYWEHRAVSLSFHRVAEASWCLSIRPERRFTRDGYIPVLQRTTGRRATSRKSRMYNEDLKEEVHFWREFLTDGQPRIIFRYGSQQIIIDAEWLTCDVV